MQRSIDWSKGPGTPMAAPAMALDPLQPTSWSVTPKPVAPAAPRPVPVAAAEPRPALDEERPEADDARPGPDALAAVQVAAEAYELLRAKQRELRFEPTDDGILKISIYDGAGRLLGTIPPTEALALASGEASWQA
jgi:hypothetical protein